MAVSSKLNSVMFADSDPPKVPIDQCLPRERSPFSPSGEKVAARPDEGAFVEGSVQERPPHPNPLPQFFARTLPCNTTQHPQRIGGEGGNMALSS